MAQINAQRPLAHVPGMIRLPGPIMRAFLRAGLQIGPNWLLTCRGRVSGEPRTQALAVLTFEGRRYVIGTFGDVNWCRNLRGHPDAEIRLGSRHDLVRGRELTPAEATVFFRDQLVPNLGQMPLFDRIVVQILFRTVAGDVLNDPETAALKRPVFELVAREA